MESRKEEAVKGKWKEGGEGGWNEGNEREGEREREGRMAWGKREVGGKRREREGVASGRKRHFAIFMRGGWSGKRPGRRKGREMYMEEERRDVQRRGRKGR